MSMQLARSMRGDLRRCAECGKTQILKPTAWAKVKWPRSEQRTVPREYLYKHVCRGEIPKRFR